MKRFLIKLLMTLLFLLLLGFAFKNTESVAVRYFLGFEWQAPLVLVLLAFFAIGIAGGFMAGIAVIVRQRRQILQLKREARHHARADAPPMTATSEAL